MGHTHDYCLLQLSCSSRSDRYAWRCSLWLWMKWRQESKISRFHSRVTTSKNVNNNIITITLLLQLIFRWNLIINDCLHISLKRKSTKWLSAASTNTKAFSPLYRFGKHLQWDNISNFSRIYEFSSLVVVPLYSVVALWDTKY